jgi:4,5-DOPA dioxygenase extradiol
MDDAFLPPAVTPDDAELAAAAETVARTVRADTVAGRMPAVYLGHGAPPLVDDPLWVVQLAAWARALPRPRAVLVVSAHWEAAPPTIGATRAGTPLVYDFYGFPERYYRTTYAAPAAPDVAARVHSLLAPLGPVAEQPERGLDHGAYVPLLVMYPDADVPILQLSLPSLDPWALLEVGAALRPLRDEGVLVMGSGFMTHGLPFLREFRTDAEPPAWSSEFDQWAAEALARGDMDGLAGYRGVPSARFAHPTADHFVPLFVTLGAAGGDAPVTTPISGYWLGLSKRSIQIA